RDTAEPGGAQAAPDRGPLGAAANASWERVGEDPLGCGANAVLGRPGAAIEDPLRATAGCPSGVPLFAVGEDLLQDPREGFLKRFPSTRSTTTACPTTSWSSTSWTPVRDPSSRPNGAASCWP